MRRLNRFALLALAFASTRAWASESAGLRGSLGSMIRQHEIALEHQYTFARTPMDVRSSVAEGDLVAIPGNADYHVLASYAVARPEVRMFVERLAIQYRDATGTPLVVTSLTRPESAQPSNAHVLSVHPAGMAVDLRVPADSASRNWLERTLLALEAAGVLDITREHYPPHYHVAVYPDAYRTYVAAFEEKLGAASATVPAPLPPEVAASTLAPLDFRAAALSTVGAGVGLLLLVRRRQRRPARQKEPRAGGLGTT